MTAPRETSLERPRLLANPTSVEPAPLTPQHAGAEKEKGVRTWTRCGRIRLALRAKVVLPPAPVRLLNHVQTTPVEPALLTPRRSGVGKQETAALLAGRARGPLAWTALGGPGLEREVSRADWMTTHVEPARLTPPGIPVSERATSREVEYSGL